MIVVYRHVVFFGHGEDVLQGFRFHDSCARRIQGVWSRDRAENRSMRVSKGGTGRKKNLTGISYEQWPGLVSLSQIFEKLVETLLSDEYGLFGIFEPIVLERLCAQRDASQHG